MSKWEHPPIIKIYEALGSVADGRVEVSGNNAKVYSSSKNKFYTITYAPGVSAIMANDNGSFWKGYLGYPAIAYLMAINILPYDEKIGVLLKGIKWKDINQKFKNNFDKTLEHILLSMSESERKVLASYVITLDDEIKKLGLKKLGTKVKPPEGY